MAKTLNNMQKTFIDSNREKHIDVLIAETGASKTAINEYLAQEPEFAPQTREVVVEVAPQIKPPTMVEMTKPKGADGKHQKGVFVLSKTVTERADEARKKYRGGISKRYTESIMKIDPDAGTY